MISLVDSHKRKVSIITLLAIFIQLLYPVKTLALTGGPSQPEYESFEPAGATEMVNLATGDFVYNIPLMDVDGYPINISYHAGVNMEQEAGWVGLGWSLNNGSINRGMRGLPDDFNGDQITETINIEANKTYGLNIGGSFEISGFDMLSLLVNTGFGISYNNYKGLGLEVEVGVTGGIAASGGTGTSLSAGLGLKISNQDGADFTMGAGIGVQAGVNYKGYGVSAGIGENRSKTNNSRRGIEADIVSGSASIGAQIKGASFGTGTGSAINLIPNTSYMPNMQYPTTYSGITGEVHVGGEVYWCNIFGSMRGYYFEQGIDYSNSNHTFTRPSFGYLNLENANPASILDFNRDNDGIYYLECPKLPFSNLTYDFFNVNAQGLNELIRPHRNDFGYVYDPLVVSTGNADAIGTEVNFGNLVGLGTNGYGTTSSSISGPWFNSTIGKGVHYRGVNPYTNNGSDTYEPVYFKALDELYKEDANFATKVFGKEIANFKLVPIGGTNTELLNLIEAPSGSSTFTTQSSLNKNSRQPRNTNMSYLTIDEAKNFAIDKAIPNCPVNVFSFTPTGDIDMTASGYTTVSRDQGLSNVGHHISELTVLKGDGSRYVYGLPVYNRQQQEVSFNCSGISPGADGLIAYNAGVDNSKNNNKGLDHFYLKREMPAYAHNYLLTALLSKNYVDITGDGLSQDDYGDYTKFNYSRTSTSYSWRNPLTGTSDNAIYEESSKAETVDDKAMYIYGEKDLWYPHSIETKNYVALFYVDNRVDGIGAAGENGGVSVSSADWQQKLTKIVLYSKKDLNTPIKTVNFEYSHKLCKTTPNSLGGGGNGKLTLEKVYFTYGKSGKGIFAPYEFKYCDFDNDNVDDVTTYSINPNYDRTQMDRWGNYQVPSGALANKDFPYTHQDSAKANASAKAWNLSSIITPAKSRIDITYESDDYGYIQDQLAGQMLTIRGFKPYKPITAPAANTADELYSGGLNTPNNYMIVDLSKMKDGGLLASSLIDAETQLKNVMLPQSNKLYFKGYVSLGGSQNVQEEYIPGYTRFDRYNSGILTTNSSTTSVTTSAGTTTYTVYKFAYVKMNDVDLDDNNNDPGDNCNPISKAGWQMTRLYHPQIAYPGSEPGNSGLAALAGLYSALTEVFTFRQKNARLRTKLYSKYINSSLSMVRMNIPSMIKYGGGHRVKRIIIADNWNNMVGSEASTIYGQTYDYTTQEAGRTISSGVASYEPLAGGDEISLRKPREYSVNRIAAPNDAHFFESPIGEAFFPPPTIIYGKVTVKNIDRGSGASLVARNIGRTEYSFYTTRQYPIYADYGDLKTVLHKPDATGDIFNSYLESSVHLSQGFVLRLNNMHGKLQSVYTFQEGNDNPISGTKYYYKSAAVGHELDNNVTVMDETGTIATNKTIGQEIETVADYRMQTTSTYGTSLMFNLNISLALIYPIPIPSVFWGSSSETRDFHSATLNKVITQQGILEKVETVSDYAISATRNMIWDANTGNVVLSRTETGFKNSDYHYNVPAHWVYNGMRGAYNNIGYSFKSAVTPTSGVINSSLVSAGLICAGDEVLLTKTNSLDVPASVHSDRLWISKNGSGALTLVTREGLLCTSTNTPALFSTTNQVLKVIRSGYRNLLDENAESITYSKDPTMTGTVSVSSITTTANILDANAQEFSEDWQKICEDIDDGCGYGDLDLYCNSYVADIFNNTNPYIRNTKGNWNTARNYAYMANRLEKNGSSVMDIREDGTFDAYKYFFKNQSGSWKTVYDAGRSDYSSASPFDSWILNSEITKITPYGDVVEAKDAINRFSSALYTYNYTMKTAAAVNARQRDIGFDGMEDYDYGILCIENHFNFRKYHSAIVDGIAHTGRRSLKVSVASNCASTIRSITNRDCETTYGRNYVVSAVTPTNSAGSCECITGWSPIKNCAYDQVYLLSTWVKATPTATADYATPAQFTVEVTFPGVGSNIAIPTAKSDIINGWQKFDYTFTIPPGTTISHVGIRLLNLGANDIYFDDIRVQPLHSTMSTYVYDPKSLRLWAELDEKNYATFYEYDNEGVLVRVKKETERGIYTMKETRNSFKKQ